MVKVQNNTSFEASKKVNYLIFEGLIIVKIVERRHLTIHDGGMANCIKLSEASCICLYICLHNTHNVLQYRAELTIYTSK